MEWIIGTVIGFLGLLGIGKLLELAFKARQDRKAVQKAIDQTNSGKAIDADVNAFNSISKRLELVEARMDDVTSQLMDQKVENAKLEADNVRLTKDNERQEKEIDRQRVRLHDLAKEIQNRDKQIYDLKVVVTQLAAEVKAMGGHTINTDEVFKVELVEPADGSDK